MQLFKRISSTVLSSVDRAVSQVENHDAVVASMLDDLQHAAAETKVRLCRVQRDGEQMRQHLQGLKDDEIKWTERASRCADMDEAKALACLHRRRHCRDEITRLNASLEQHSQTEHKLASQQKKIEQRTNEISQQRHLMKSKEAMADAQRVAAAVSGGSYGDIDDAFDRWEISIAKTAFTSDEMDDQHYDALDREFSEQESESTLRAELDALKNK
ncbi:MAG: PspA/IM30 family protein [Thiotrichaceae bacterium]|nr:PspA/IM30 family protein [Thiotrichaceae bacterium]